ncbi:MAG: MinD/ParA family protein [Gemmataceae bacterium]|nr:MinD/ParA family protein [Gemmataceae bacterium]
MSKIVSVHSFRGGTGKSNLTANLSTCLALQGRRVGIVDTDIQSPGIHVIFGLDQNVVTRALNDFLWGNCEIEQTAYDITPAPVQSRGGSMHLIPSSIKAGEIAKVLREGYDVERLTEGFQAVVERLRLDYLVIDTHPGLNEETLLSMALSDTLVLILRPDRQDFQGTAVTVEVAKRLKVPDLLLVVNKAFPGDDFDALRIQVEDTYHCPVAAVLPQDEDMMRLASGGVFILHYPDHPFTRTVQALAARVAQQVP